MILKIERYTKEQHWWILDNIHKVSISKMLFKRPLCEEHAEIRIFDMPKTTCSCRGDDEGCSNCQSYLRLICRKSDGEEFAVVFDTIAYLLNDDGKTIEKIVANYKE